MTRTRAIALDFLERAGWTAGQVFVTVLLTTGGSLTVINLPWGLALAMAGGAAIASLVTTALLYLAKWKNRSFWPDLGIRLTKTFLSSFAGSFAADVFNVLTFDWGAAFDLAIVATLTALAKGLLSRQTGESADKPNPSTLPPDTYNEAVRT